MVAKLTVGAACVCILRTSGGRGDDSGTYNKVDVA